MGLCESLVALPMARGLWRLLLHAHQAHHHQQEHHKRGHQGQAQRLRLSTSSGTVHKHRFKNESESQKLRCFEFIISLNSKNPPTMSLTTDHFFGF